MLLLAGCEVSPRRQNHYLAFGLSEPIDHRGMTPAQIVERVSEAGGFGFLAHPFSKGSERFKRGGEGMPWRDLDAEGYTGIELWSFVTDTAERVNSIRELVSLHRAPERFIDHPPQRNLDEWDRLCARRRCVALGGVDAHQVGIRVAGRVPLRLMAYKRSFRHLRTHLLLREPLRRELEPDRAAVFGALRVGPCLHRGGLARTGARLPVLGRGRRASRSMGDEAPAGDWTLRVAHSRCPRAMRLMRDGAEVATATRQLRSSTRADGPGVYRVEAYRDAHGRERTWILSNPIYLR